MKHQVPLKHNPFETIWSRRKFDILGKRRKGEERRVGLSRSREKFLEVTGKRKNTLLKEYEQSNKASVFVDKRIGEHNDELNEFDKAIRRAQREHQTNKKSKYNLPDGEEDDFEFQSLGALSERDDFEDDVLPADDDDGTETTQTKITGDGRDDSGNPFDCDTSSESIICTQGLTGWRERIAGIF
ncbi:uncharacterized protein LOC126614367 isoform X7 [Malus sylvestris]|nr:uncharacterized protein LOC126614367 isoform X7 [Malus sylvestris]